MVKRERFAIFFLFLAASSAANDSTERQLLNQVLDTVTLVKKINGVVVEQRMSRSELGRCCPDCLNLDGRHYYDDMRTLVERNGNHDQAVARANKRVIDACASRVPVGTSVAVQGTRTAVCGKGRKAFQASESRTVSYLVSRTADGVHLAQLGRFVLDPRLPADRRAEIRRNAERCVQTMKWVWARYGIAYDFTHTFSQGPGVRSPRPEDLLIVDQRGESHADAVSYQGPVGADFENDQARQTAFCTSMLRGFAQRLGLFDEFRSLSCPDRSVAPERKPWSLMGEPGHQVGELDLFERHLKTVVGPLCGENQGLSR